MKFCEVINDFAEHMTRLEQKLFLNVLIVLTSCLPTHSLNIIIRKNETKYNLARFLHADIGIPTNSTLLHSIKKNYLSTFPGLTTKLITRNLPPQKSTIRAHIKQEYQNLQSTKVVQVTLEDSHADAFPTPDTPNVKTNGIFCKLMQTKKETGKAYIDLTGRFHIRSSRGK